MRRAFLMRYVFGLTLVVFSLVAPSWSGAASLDLVPTSTPPIIDGIISEGEWSGAAHSDSFRMVEPVEDGDPTERTEFWVTFDADTIYVAVRLHDSAGVAGINAVSMQRDQDNGTDDFVRLVFDTFHRQSDGYYFGLTAAGGRHDGLIQNKDEGNSEWDAIWLGRTSIDDGGWSAEFAIPVKSLSFDPASETWGFNLARNIRRKQEQVRWTGIIRNRPSDSLSLLGELHGLTGLRQGRGIDLKPFVSLTRRSDPPAGENEYDFKPGLDLIWHVTPSLAATLTINTDFADAEVDERQVNLGRFSRFFPEKRAFFNQDASLFTFSGIQRNPLPFFSRRIGLANNGSKVDLLGGLKITGRAGPWSIGLLDVQLDEHAGVDSNNVLVGRISRQVLAESSAGLIFTHGDPNSNGSNTLLGADFNYVNNHVFGEKSLVIESALQATDSDRTGSTGTAATVSVEFPNDPFTINLEFNRIDEDYDPALGFVSRTGIRSHNLFTRWRWYPTSHGLNEVEVAFRTNIVTDLPGRRLDREINFPRLQIETAGDSDFQLEWHDNRERLDEPFEIRPGIIIPLADYHTGYFTTEYRTSRSRPVNIQLEWRHGGFYGGDRDDYSFEAGWRPSRHLGLSAEYGLRDIRLPQGSFVVRTASATVNCTFSPDLQLNLFAQYDNLSNSVGMNLRLRWIMQPGNEVFFVVNQGYDTSLDRFRPIGNETSMKGAWTYRF